MKITTKQFVIALWGSAFRPGAMWGKAAPLLGVAILCAGLAHAASAKISRDLNTAAAGNVDVIVQYDQVPTAAHHQKVYSRGGKMKRDLLQFKGGAYTMPASQVESLASDPSVVHISPDRPLRNLSTGSTSFVLDRHTDMINASAAWAQGLNGAGVGVAVIDSGIAPVPDLTGNDIYAVASGTWSGQSNASGGDANFAADEFYSGGSTDSVTNAISVAGVANAAPASVYQTERFEPFTYTFQNLIPGVQYSVLLQDRKSVV